MFFMRRSSKARKWSRNETKEEETSQEQEEDWFSGFLQAR